jgi:hypothetical protein
MVVVDVDVDVCKWKLKNDECIARKRRLLLWGAESRLREQREILPRLLLYRFGLTALK